MTPSWEEDLLDIAREIETIIDLENPSHRQLLEPLLRQRARSRDNVLQLAALGQFKRGKSTLLNAFVSFPLLRAGVLPLTSVPTYLTRGAPTRISVSYSSGDEETHETTTLEDLANEIAAATTEEQNPHNEKQVQRVAVYLSDCIWLEDVTLIDTPGVGSTYSHNTESAHAVLPECDAALFVCSVDPPITEVEVAYLERICRTAPRVIVVLNKIDLVDEADAKKAIEFLSCLLAERFGAQVDSQVFAVSARRALTARRTSDQELLERSGVLKLEQYIRSSLFEQKRRVLSSSITAKLSEIVATLTCDAALSAAALSLPLAELDKTIALFEESVIEFDRERTALDDVLEGERRRAIDRLRSACDEVHERVTKELMGKFHSFVDRRSLIEATSIATHVMAETFDREFALVIGKMRSELDANIEAQQHRYTVLVDRVRAFVGSLLGVAMAPAAPADWLQIRREPYWVATRPLETLSSLTIDSLTRLLPSAWRRRRETKHFRAALRNAVIRNVSDLEWTMAQNIEDSFRRLRAASREAVEASVSGTRELLAKAGDMRRTEASALQGALAHAGSTERRLRELGQALDAISGAGSS